MVKQKDAENDSGAMNVDAFEEQYNDVEEPDKNNVQAWNKALEAAKINNSVSENK